MLIKVRVNTNSRAEEIVWKAADSYVISVKEKAERNMANRRVLDIFKALYPGQAVRLVKGQQSSAKIVEVS